MTQELIDLKELQQAIYDAENPSPLDHPRTRLAINEILLKAARAYLAQQQAASGEALDILENWFDRLDGLPYGDRDEETKEYEFLRAVLSSTVPQSVLKQVVQIMDTAEVLLCDNDYMSRKLKENIAALRPYLK